MKGSNWGRAGLQVCLVMLLAGLTCAMVGCSQSGKSSEPPITIVHSVSSSSASSSSNDSSDGGTAVKPSLSEYSWKELKAIADEIATAADDNEGLRVARKYNLTQDDGVLDGGEKPVTLSDGKTAYIRILDFRHDDLVAGGKAGITFEFSDVPMSHYMNEGATNAGGWGASDMRAWLNGTFYKKLPEDLRNQIAEVYKRTNNQGWLWDSSREGNNENNVEVVDATSDKLWLLSLVEVYGTIYGRGFSKVPWSPLTFDAEGYQYQLYADRGVSLVNGGFCAKSGKNPNWWLRSANADYRDYFLRVLSDGGWYGDAANVSNGVSPGFCI